MLPAAPTVEPQPNYSAQATAAAATVTVTEQLLGVYTDMTHNISGKQGHGEKEKEKQP